METIQTEKDAKQTVLGKLMAGTAQEETKRQQTPANLSVEMVSLLELNNATTILSMTTTGVIQTAKLWQAGTAQE